MTKFVQGVTVLEVTDIKASETFYREKLAFRPGLFFGEPPTFCIMSKDNVAIFPRPRPHTAPQAAQPILGAILLRR